MMEIEKLQLDHTHNLSELKKLYEDVSEQYKCK